MNLVAHMLGVSGIDGAKAAIVTGEGGRVGFSELLGWSSRLAAAWKRAGVQKGDRVVIAMGLGPGLYAGLAALWRLGAVAVLPEPAMGLSGLRHAARATTPKAYLTEGWLRALGYALQELWRVPLTLTPSDSGPAGGDLLEELEPDHPALISFTSGSTGRPKSILRTHGFLLNQNDVLKDLLAPEREYETDLVAFPVFVLANLGQGVTSVLPNWNLKKPHEADAAAICAHIAANRVTRALVPPSICEGLAATGRDPGLATIFTGGGPVFPDMMERLAQNSRTRVVAVYGSTEAEPIAHLEASEIESKDWEAMRTGAGLLAGRPIDAIRLNIVADEIVVTGGHVNKGYLDPADDASTKIRRDGEVWHRTGDGGRLDATGRLWLTGRLDGRAAGLSSFCVEAAARLWPGVKRCALVEKDGRAVLAVEGEQATIAEWRRAASSLGDIEIRGLKAVPLDRRHRSKVDYVRLKQLL
jgi:acyl-coenzyme A synthetase/AMP-(fatty) acid ligase